VHCSTSLYLYADISYLDASEKEHCPRDMSNSQI
jgi:hypothetical protein